MLESVNPATGEPIATYEEHDEDEVTWRLARSWTTFERWRTYAVDRRAELLRAAGELLTKRLDPLSRLMTEEMGKPISASRAEVEKCAWGCRHYADAGPDFLVPEMRPTEATRSYVRFDPLGPLLAVMPWNFPLWQVFRFAAPTLVAGNTVLLKHASNVTGCALAIQGLLLDAGLPEGVFQTLLIPSSRVGSVIADERVRGVTLTGSEAAGTAVAAAAGEHLKKTVLELGGSDPFVVLDDADVERAAEVAATSRMLNCGQSCISAKRFVVHAAIYEPFLDLLEAHVRAMVVGDPMDETTDVGPLARDDLRDELNDQVERSVADGATLVCGGSALDRAGYYYAPTILSEVTPANPAGAEETFGPVAAVMRAAGEDEAVALANASRYGLGASVWTSDPQRGERIAAAIEAGNVFVNELVKSDPRLPFGGVKHSGYGRELSREGIREFVNLKTVWVS